MVDRCERAMGETRYATPTKKPWIWRAIYVKSSRNEKRVGNNPINHKYISTACHHETHTNCRAVCKWCPAPCRCECHDAKEQRDYQTASNRYNRYMEDPDVDSADRDH